MNVRPLAASGLLVASSWMVVGLATPALAVCDAYSGGCPSPAVDGQELDGGDQTPSTGGDTDSSGTDGGGSGTNGGGSADGRPSTLPFTGGELVLLSAVGIGALVGGTALVVAGRRKAATTA